MFADQDTNNEQLATNNVLRLLPWAACLALLLAAPLPAAADNECMPIGVDPSATPGVADNYECDGSSYGDGVTYTADGDLSIDFTASPTVEIEAGGIDLSATGGDSIFFDSASTNTEIESREVTGALLNVTTANGDIDIDTEEMDADGQTPDGVTHAIFAESTGSGSIDITTVGTVDAAGSNPDDSIGIQAVTGSGDLTITASGAVAGNDAAIDATTGSGLLTINATGGSGSVGQQSDVGIRATAGADVVINVGSGRQVFGGVDLTAAGVITLNNDGRVAGRSGVGEFAIQAADGSLTLNNDGDVDGAVDFSDLTGGYTFNNNGLWDIRSDVQTGDLATVQRISTLGVGTINNAGTIQFGNNKEVVQAEGATFNGLTGSAFLMPMSLNAAGQSDCMGEVASCLDLTGGTTTGQTEILITLVAPPLDPAGDLTSTANPGILVVDVTGGTTAADHFVLDPDSDNYAVDPSYGPIIDTGGIFDYTLLHNPDSQEHHLVTVPQRAAVEYAAFIDEALSIWHTTADAVAGRQADLRGGATGGGWVRLVNERTTRDSQPSMTIQGNDFVYDVGYTLDTRAALFGFDVMHGDNYVIGLHGGLISSDLDYDASGNKNETKGAAAGVYGGWWQDIGVGQLTVDATVNGNFVKADHKNDFENTSSNVKSLGVRAEAGWRYPVINGFYVQPLATAAYVRTNIPGLKLRANKLSFQNEESQRVALGVRLGGEFEVDNGITARYWLTGRAWDESAEDANVQFATESEPFVLSDDLSGSFEELGFGASLSNAEDTLSVYASGGTKDRDDTTNYNISVGARLRW